MTTARPQLGSRTDIDAQVSALRLSGRHIQPVLWQGRPAWLKLSVPQPPAWRYQLLAGVARLLQHPAMQPVRPQGGVSGIRNEARRLAELAAAGLHVPQVLEHDDHWLLISDLGHVTLESLIRHAAPAEQLEHWQRGAAAILQAHRSGQYLSQAFARNLVWSPEHGLGAIDFEDDPISAMTLAQAQIRDWLPYFFSTAIFFGDRLPVLCAAIHAVLAQEDAAVREGVYTALRRTAWLRSLRWLPRQMQRRDVLKTQCFGELARLCSKPAPGPRS
ncbi:MAG: hypothetical protein A2X71_01810 [Thiobacillus sp. GWE1_62_9]|nr:MAG: hypothetical protein A2X71_01810 [Thiobacillus sp. GWE1_62_9]